MRSLVSAGMRCGRRWARSHRRACRSGRARPRVPLGVGVDADASAAAAPRCPGCRPRRSRGRRRPRSARRARPGRRCDAGGSARGSRRRPLPRSGRPAPAARNCKCDVLAGGTRPFCGSARSIVRGVDGAVDRAHQLLVQRLPGTGQAADVAAAVALADVGAARTVLLSRPCSLAQLRRRELHVVDRQVDRAVVRRQLDDRGLEHARPVDQLALALLRCAARLAGSDLPDRARCGRRAARAGAHARSTPA